MHDDEHPRRVGSSALCCGYAVVLGLLLAGTLEREPYDDSYFFKRVAVNALEHHGLSWNVDEGPVYGSTSQLFQAVVVGLTALTRDHTMLATRLFLALCLVASLGLLLRATWRRDAGVNALLAAGSPVMLYAALSGMETALAFALLAGLLVVLYGERDHALHWALAPLVAVLIWLARPDAMLLAFPLLVERSVHARRLPWREAALLGGCVGSLLLLFKLYYGTALPLPFYAKQQLTTPYDAHFLELARVGQRARFAYFATLGLPLFAIGALRADRINAWLLGAALLFELYHFSTVDVMGMHGRFYAPAVPLLVLAAARAFETARRRRGALAGLSLLLLLAFGLARAYLLPAPGNRLEGAPLAYDVAGVAGALLVLAALGWPMLRGIAPPLLLLGAACATLIGHPPRALGLTSDARFLELHESRVTVYRGLEALRSCIGDTIHVYHSEVGVPGLRFQHGKVTDLAGLLSPDWLFRRQSFDARCFSDRPEAIFLPHKNYQRLNQEITNGQCIHGYRRVIAASASPLYVRKDLVERYKQCARLPGKR